MYIPNTGLYRPVLGMYIHIQVEGVCLSVVLDAQHSMNSSPTAATTTV